VGVPSKRVQRRIDRLLDDAEQAADRKQWGDVAESARMALKLDPDNADARALLSMVEDVASESEASATSPTAPLAPGAPSREDVASASVAQPTSFASGRYEVRKFLGEGGKKKVYLAHDIVLDRDVAFALIKTAGLDEAARARVIREAQVMGRLGDHPHLMPIHDLGREGDQPFMVLPVMAGGDVEDLIEKAQDHRLPLERVKEIGVAVCRGLQFAHSHGIIHRDLKPGNIWLAADGTPKIGDFGLALPMERTRLTQAGMMVGTVAYMPPEQALGGEITPRADLYSLGCVLYEMVTGRPPFLGDDHVAVIGQHINTPPVAPTWHRPDCAKPLEALVMRLLAKDPAQRPESATDALAALDALDLRQPAVLSATQPEPGESRSLESLAGGVFVGRQKETGELRAALEEALSGHGKLLMLVGEPGIGKTRTALELTTYAGLRRCQVLWGRCYEGGGAPSYWPWVQTLRSYVRSREPDQLRRELGSGAAEIAEIVSEVRERLPDLKSPTVHDSQEEARFRLFDSITAFLKAASSSQPIVVVLDDLHWADKPSLLLLQFIARELTGARLLLLGTYRDVELSRQHPLAETLGDLNREHLFGRILLRGLTEEDVGKFIEMTSGIKPPTDLVRAVHTQTEGNPLFVTEVVRLLVQEGHLTQESVATRPGQESATWTVRIPEGVREVIGRRLNRLSARCNEILTVAAVLGREFTLQQLGAVTDGMTEDMLLPVVEEALAARVIEEITTAVGRYQFTHALIQETLVNELSLTRRVRFHARVAESLEALYGENAKAHAAELAFHFDQAQAVLGTIKFEKYCIAAGERCLENRAWENAISYFERALRSKDGQPIDRASAKSLTGLARAQIVMLHRLDLRQATEKLMTAFDFFLKADDHQEALRVAETRIPFAEGLDLGARHLMERALPLAPDGSPQRARLLAHYAYHVGLAGDFDEARKAFEEALSIVRRGHDATAELRVLAESVQVSMYHVRWQHVAELARALPDVAQRADDPLIELQAWSNASFSSLCAGESGVAEQHARAGLKAAEKSRSPLVQAQITCASVAMSRGDWGVARDFVNRALEMSPRDPRGPAWRAHIELELGNADEAIRDIDALLGLTEGIAITPIAEHAHVSWLIPLAAYVFRVSHKLERGVAASSLVLTNSKLPLSMMLARVGSALIAIERRDVATTQEQYRNLLGHRGTFWPVSHDRLLGLLAATFGDLNSARAHFEESLSFCRKSGYRPELAWCCFDFASALSQSASPANDQKANALLAESLTIARELRMKPLVERLIARKRLLTA
jgi:tetratricopeptide (TPR) repeat protein